MRFEIQLFGALREAEPGARLVLESPATTVRELRAAVDAHANTQWTAAARALLARSAFANSDAVLRDAEPLPADGHLALLPPVSGG
ncbi:MoaD/ThiS family protein [Lysobacter xanthus]